MPAIAIAIVGSTLVGVLLVGALVAIVGRVMGFVDAHYGSPRTPAKPSGTPARSDGPDWWPRFEREFAEYVDQLGERRV